MIPASPLRMRIAAVYALLALTNVGAWLWAVAAFHGTPALSSAGLAVYGLGLRHAVDADHIAAIDNVTRKLLQDRQRPVSIGLFFAAGHSTVVLIVVAAILGATRLFDSMQAFRTIGSNISTIISAGFLVLIAMVNISTFAALWKTWCRLRAGETVDNAGIDILLNGRGVLARISRPLFRIITKSWHMFPLGFLFGLGFDTATEVAMFGVSATQVSHGMPIYAVLAFPALFAAGMMLVDSTDGIAMLRAYEWAFVRPVRKVFYNMAITLVSVVVALLIASIEAIQLIGDNLHLNSGIWRVAAFLNEHFNEIGLIIIGVFLVAWTLSYLIYKAKGQVDFDVPLPWVASSR